MCGINGHIQFKNTKSPEEMQDLVHRMNEQIIHRGPDHEGLYSDEHCALGMRRLSIIDLQGGNQPIWNEDHTKVIVFNGEIYNYRELKEKLISKGHIFQTETDTEVIIVAYDEYGADCFDMLEGMFALAIYDTKEKIWIIARDRAGEKPLYYYTDNDSFSFASELKSLSRTGLINKKIDVSALSTYFQLTYIPAPKTIYENVFKLMPGSFLTISESGEIKESKYWTLLPHGDIERYHDYTYCRKALRHKLFKSIERCMISDVPLGAFLSGGFDSSIVVGIMSHISNKPINTFNIGFKEKQFDESELAEIVAKKNNTHHTKLMLDWDEVLKDIDHVLENIDEPFADSSLIATYAVSRLTKQHVTVALTGDAGDELFAGYDKYLGNYYGEKYRKIPGILRKGIIEPIISKLPYDKTITRKLKKVITTAQMDDLSRAIWLMSLGFKDYELIKLCRNADTESLSFIRDQYELLDSADIQTRTQYVDFLTVLEGDMLTKVDRASMLTSLETRVPMLDKNLIELAFNLPTEYKISGKRRKIILKETFRDLLPNELFSAPKHGFGVPIGKWIEYDLRTQLNKYLSKDFIGNQGLFDFNYINSLVNDHMNHKSNRYSELWTFFVFQNWYEREFCY